MERLIVEKKNEKNNMPIEWSKNDADIMSLAGIWKNQPRTIGEIRKKAWKRVNRVLTCVLGVLVFMNLPIDFSRM